MDGVSPRYLPPTWETPFTLFGVKTSGDAFLAFSHPKKHCHFVLCLRDSRFDSDTHLDTSGLHDNKSIVSVENIELTNTEYSWFVVFKKERTLAVYRSGKLDPFLLYQASDKTRVMWGLVERRELQQTLDYASAIENNKKSKVARRAAKEIVSTIKPLRVLLKFYNHNDPSRRKQWPSRT
ncbi:hypothetical protein Pmani_027996 [Petrolisthes manimaculis]|uniref:Uncharacterized protein n=1 Tax=Petrolisthes manimaculis TaxID=1843537 RepID=A0AAE1P2D1_9EUCA|nr:hypothetical protein Pmani_027996 [Petrolisthes manimaculis]